MRYLTTITLKLKTSTGEIQLKAGDTFRPNSPDAVKSLLEEGKIKPFCYWLKSVVDDCQMPCFEISAMTVNHECPHFRGYWKKRLKENKGISWEFGRELAGGREKKYLKTLEVLE